MNNTLVDAEWLYAHLEDPNLIILDASQEKNKANLRRIDNDKQIKNARHFDLTVFSDQETELPHMLAKQSLFEKECKNLGINESSHLVVYDDLGVYFSPRV